MVETEVSTERDVLGRLMAGRFSCRAYLPDAVPEEVIRSIVKMAGSTASWCNVQPWHAVITTGEATEGLRKILMERARTHPGVDSDLPFPPPYQGVHLARRREAGYALYNALGITRDDKERRAQQSFENFRLFGAPHVAIVTTARELGPYGIVDCGGFLANFLLAARAHGVATTPQAALAQHAPLIRAHLGIGDERSMVCGISLGYADLAHPANRYRTTRVPTDDIMRLA